MAFPPTKRYTVLMNETENNNSTKNKKWIVLKITLVLLVIVVLVGYFVGKKIANNYRQGQQCIEASTTCDTLLEKIATEKNRCEEMLSQPNQGLLKDFNYCEQFIEWEAK